jgi:hypothetical protein
MIHFACPNCKYPYRVADGVGGRTATCRQCRTQIVVPQATSVANWQSAPPPVRRDIRLPELPPFAEKPAPAPPQAAQPVIVAVHNTFTAPAYPFYEPAPGSGGLVCCILGVVFGSVGFLFCPFLFSVAGLALAIVGTVLSERKALGIVGIALSAGGLFFGFIWWSLLLAAARGPH